jgi:hypothetical protein
MALYSVSPITISEPSVTILPLLNNTFSVALFLPQHSQVVFISLIVSALINACLDPSNKASLYVFLSPIVFYLCFLYHFSTYLFSFLF